MKVHHRAFGIAAIGFLASFLGFITRDANGAPNVLLPTYLLCLSGVAMAAGLAGRYGSSRMKTWVITNF